MKLAKPMERFVLFTPTPDFLPLYPAFRRQIVVEFAVQFSKATPELRFVFHRDGAIQFCLLLPEHRQGALQLQSLILNALHRILKVQFAPDCFLHIRVTGIADQCIARTDVEVNIGCGFRRRKSLIPS